MGLKDLFKDDSKRKNGEKKRRSRTKPQYNKNIARNVTAKVKALVPFYNLSEAIIAEQCLEIGAFYLIRVTQDQEKLKEMKNHLIKDHYFKTEPSENDEIILRMGEEGDLWTYLEGIRAIVKSYSLFRRTLKPGGGAMGFNGDIHALGNFLRSFEKFYIWVHHNQSVD